MMSISSTLGDDDHTASRKVEAPVPHPTRHGAIVRGGKPDAAFGVKVPRKPYQALRVRRKR